MTAYRLDSLPCSGDGRDGTGSCDDEVSYFLAASDETGSDVNLLATRGHDLSIVEPFGERPTPVAERQQRRHRNYRSTSGEDDVIRPFVVRKTSTSCAAGGGGRRTGSVSKSLADRTPTDRRYGTPTGKLNNNNISNNGSCRSSTGSSLIAGSCGKNMENGCGGSVVAGRGCRSAWTHAGSVDLGASTATAAGCGGGGGGMSANDEREMLTSTGRIGRSSKRRTTAVTTDGRSLKNLVVLGCAFMFWLTAFTSLQSLQSTLNPRAGVVSLAGLYGATLVSCFLAPAVIGALTAKWTIVAAYSLFLAYVGAQFYPRHALMLPASLLAGSMTGPLWSAQSTYLTTLAVHYAATTASVSASSAAAAVAAGRSGSVGSAAAGRPVVGVGGRELPDPIINRFNGIFGGLMQTSQVWGSLISALVLSADNETVHLTRGVNRSACSTTAYCGAHGCSTPFGAAAVRRSSGPQRPDYAASFASAAWQQAATDEDDFVPHHAAPLSVSARSWLLSVEAGCVVMAILLPTVLLDRNPVPRDDGGGSGSDGGGGGIAARVTMRHEGLPTRQLLLATVKMLTDPRLQLLAPLVFYTGLEQGFIITDFTKVEYIIYLSVSPSVLLAWCVVRFFRQIELVRFWVCVCVCVSVYYNREHRSYLCEYKKCKKKV